MIRKELLKSFTGIRTTVTGRPDPIVVSLPEDVLLKNEMLIQTFSEFETDISEKEVTRFTELLKQASKPIIIAGGGVKTEMRRMRCYAFQKYHLPVITAFRRFDIFPNHIRFMQGT